MKLLITCRIQKCLLCRIGMLGLSHEFIKILDEEMGRLRNICYMLYMKKEILVIRRTTYDQVCDQESIQSKMLNRYLEGKDI